MQYLPTYFRQATINRTHVSKQTLLFSYVITFSPTEFDMKDIDLPKDCPYEDLLIWAVLENRPNLASIFWMKSKNQLRESL